VVGHAGDGCAHTPFDLLAATLDSAPQPDDVGELVRGEDRDRQSTRALTWSRSAALRSSNESMVASSVRAMTSKAISSPISLRSSASLSVPRSTASCRSPTATSSSSNAASCRNVAT
jgi:hypothetical protein